MRKCALLLEKVELELAKAGEDAGPVAAVAAAAAAANLLSYAHDLCAFLASAPDSSPEVAAAAAACVASTAARDDLSLAFRAINDFRHILMRISGQAPADWDLHDFRSARSAFSLGVSVAGGEADGKANGAGDASAPRPYIPGLRVYLEDIRSPFNVGTIMRTAEAFGFEEVLLSPDCADPRHPRAARSSMGAVDMIPWRRAALAELPPLGPLFALELGGTALADFTFPARGVLILGSEELGVSAPALTLAGERRVSIPMRGIKASINVAVAFGIAAQAWVSVI